MFFFLRTVNVIRDFDQNQFLLKSKKHVFWVVLEIRTKTKKISRFFLKKKLNFWKICGFRSQNHIFSKNSAFFTFFLRKKRDIFVRFCPDFENHSKHMLFWLEQKMVFDQNLESHLLYEEKNMWKVEVFSYRLHSEKMCFFKKIVLNLLFKNKTGTVFLS